MTATAGTATCTNATARLLRKTWVRVPSRLSGVTFGRRRYVESDGIEAVNLERRGEKATPIATRRQP